MESTTEVSTSRVAKNTTYLTAALIGQKLLSFIYVYVLARLVGTTIAGDYFSTLSFVTLYTIFIDVGLTPALIRSVARQPDQGPRQFSIIITFKLITGLIVAAALYTTMVVIDRSGQNHPGFHFVQWGMIIMILDSLTNTAYAYFRGLQRLEFESFGTIIHRLVVMIVGITGLVLQAPPIITMVALFSGSVANLANASYHLWRQRIAWRPTWSWVDLRGLLKIAWPFAVAALFTALYSSSDNLLLSFIHGSRAVALYALAYKISIAFQILPSALVAAIFPAMSASFIQNKDRLGTIFTRSIEYLMIVVMPISVILVALAEPIIITGWTKVWSDAIEPLRILALGLPFLFLNFPVGYLLNAANRQTRNTVHIGITVVLNIAANLLFIEKYTYHSVAIISVISSALLFFLGLSQARKIIRIEWRRLGITLSKTIIAGGLLSLAGWKGIGWASGKQDFLLVGAGMAVLYIVLMFALRLIRRQDINFFLSYLRRT